MPSLLAASSRFVNMWRTDATQHLQILSLGMRKIIGKITKIFTKSGWWNIHLLQNLIFMIQSCLEYQIPRKKERSRLAANVTIKPNLCENPTYTNIGPILSDSDNFFIFWSALMSESSSICVKKILGPIKKVMKKGTSGKDNKIG